MICTITFLSMLHKAFLLLTFIIACPQPEHISQTSVIVEVSPYDRIVKYQCENGTIGAGNITCQSDLTWTAPYFTCSGKHLVMIENLL